LSGEVVAVYVAAAVSLLGALIMALVAWGWRAEMATHRADMGTLRAETRASLAEAANEFYRRVNGNYVKKEVYHGLVARVDELAGRVEDIGN
jgi:ribulose kinase